MALMAWISTDGSAATRERMGSKDDTSFIVDGKFGGIIVMCGG